MRGPGATERAWGAGHICQKSARGQRGDLQTAGESYPCPWPPCRADAPSSRGWDMAAPDGSSPDAALYECHMARCPQGQLSALGLLPHHPLHCISPSHPRAHSCSPSIPVTRPSSILVGERLDISSRWGPSTVKTGVLPPQGHTCQEGQILGPRSSSVPLPL